ISAKEVETGLSFQMERKNGLFAPSSADASKVARSFPNFQAPAKQIADYLLVRSEFYKVFGDKKKPTDIVAKFGLKQYLDEGSTTEGVLDGWTQNLGNFISGGQVQPKKSELKNQLETAIRVCTFTFADPTMGALFQKTLRTLKDNASLAPEARKRVAFLLSVYQARDKFSEFAKSTAEKSEKVSYNLKAASTSVMVFLFANHILADRGFKDFLASDTDKTRAAEFHEILSKVDPNYNASRNYYATLGKIVGQLKGLDLPDDLKNDFDSRAQFLENEFAKAGRQEMLDLLAKQDPEKSLREYLQIKYGDSPEKAMVFDVFLKNLKIKSVKDQPSYDFAMAKISTDLQAQISSLPIPEKIRMTGALLSILQELFEKDGKMEIYWNKGLQESKNFYSSFSLLGTNKNELEKLILWTRGEAKNNPEIKSPKDIPHVSIRKWTLITELGIGAVGTGVALGLLATKDGDPRYYGQGAATIAAGAGFGAAAGNLLSYGLDIDKGDWVFDLTGSLLGGLAGGLTYGFTVAKPSGKLPPVKNPGQRFPVDPYGP
ncbi:MAG: hypothetical protein K8R69_01645, partial [Deltaproteobacteria bacterium]|nr:hypothetical protein [Deltaproteobacteria bacterium]